ncbi:MAG TPA: AraC family transcriptional regulator [Clostridium sp.]|nr:AraC family transcriptional regulator [Clostridium sp.]
MAYISTRLKKEIEITEIITIHYFEYLKGFVFHGESHDFWEFLYVDKGTVMVQAASEHYQLHAGDIIFHRPNEFHSVKAIGRKSPNLVAISFLCNSPSMDFFTGKVTTLSSIEKTLIAQIISEARAAFSTPLHIPSIEQVKLSTSAPFGSQQLILLYLEQFLIHIKRHHCDDEKVKNLPSITKQSWDSSNKSYVFEQILHYLQLHICEQIKISDICNEFSISRSTLHSLFQKNKNCGVIDYFIYMKIERAKEIIRDGNMNITEIAYFLSYNSLQHFSKQFKKLTGMSPTEYISSVKGISQTYKW